MPSHVYPGEHVTLTCLWKSVHKTPQCPVCCCLAVRLLLQPSACCCDLSTETALGNTYVTGPKAIRGAIRHKTTMQRTPSLPYWKWTSECQKRLTIRSRQFSRVLLLGCRQAVRGWPAPESSSRCWPQPWVCFPPTRRSPLTLTSLCSLHSQHSTRHQYNSTHKTTFSPFRIEYIHKMMFCVPEQKLMTPTKTGNPCSKVQKDTNYASHPGEPSLDVTPTLPMIMWH